MAASNVTLACIGGRYARELLANNRLTGERVGERATPFGRSQTIYRCERAGGTFYLLLRHSDGPVPIASSFVNHRANIYALKELGVTHIIGSSAARAVSHNYRVGQFVVARDLIDETRHRPGTFFEHGAIVDLRQWPVFCPTLQAVFGRAMDCAGVKYTRGGTYLCSEGPRRETPAEVHKYATWGADLLGHSLAPETFLARELQMCYASLCYVADYAETGSGHRPFQAGWLFDEQADNDGHQRACDTVALLPEIIENVLAGLAEAESRCTCSNGLAEVIDNGTLTSDFRTWFKTLRPARGSFRLRHRSTRPKVPGSSPGGRVRESSPDRR